MSEIILPRLSHYLIKHILEYIVSITNVDNKTATSTSPTTTTTIQHCNLITQEIIFTFTLVSKDFRNKLVPKIEFPLYAISDSWDFDKVYYFYNRLKIEFKRIKILDFQDWSDNIVLKLNEQHKEFNNDHYKKSIHCISGVGKDGYKLESLHSNLNNIEKKKEFSKYFKSNVTQVNFVEYKFNGDELVYFKNVSNVKIYTDDQFPMVSILSSLSNLEKQDTEDKCCKMIEKLFISSDEDLDFTNETLKSFTLSKLVSLKELVLASHIGNDLNGLSNLFSLSNTLKSISITNCKISPLEMKIIFQSNVKSIDTLNLVNSLQENLFSQFINELSSNKQFKKVILNSTSSESEIKLSSIIQLFKFNKTLTQFSFNSKIENDILQLQQPIEPFQEDEDDLTFSNDTIELLEIQANQTIELFEYGKFKSLKSFRVNVISEKCKLNLIANNSNTLESILLCTASLTQTQSSIDNIGEIIENSNCLKSIKIKIIKSFLKFGLRFDTSKQQSTTTEINFNNLFKSISSSSKSKEFNELFIQSGHYIDENLISNFIQSNHPTITNFTLICGRFLKWSTILQQILNNNTLTTISIDNTPGDTVQQVDLINLISDVIRNNTTCTSLSINHSHSPISKLDPSQSTTNLTDSIYSNQSITYLSLPHRIQKFPTINEAMIKKLIKFKNNL